MHIQPDTHMPRKPRVKIYNALLTQAGTAAPTAKILRNTTFNNITWTRITAGQYQGIFDTPVTITNVAIDIPNAPANGATTYAYMTNTTTIVLQTPTGGSYLDDQLQNTEILIKIYEL